MSRRRAGPPDASPPIITPLPDAPAAPPATVAVVGVGASAGGLEAFSELLTHLPLDTGFAFVLVQHLDPQHESALAMLLGRVTALPVREVTDHERVAANHVYVIPPNTDLTLADGVLALQSRPDTRAPHRSIDFFFETLARDCGARAIGVILSGTATDGTLGLEAIKAAGGITFAQDRSGEVPVDAAQRRGRWLRGFRALADRHRARAGAHCRASSRGSRPRGARGRGPQRGASPGRSPRPRRVGCDSAAAAQPCRRGFLALQDQHRAASHHPAHDRDHAPHGGGLRAVPA